MIKPSSEEMNNRVELTKTLTQEGIKALHNQDLEEVRELLSHLPSTPSYIISLLEIAIEETLKNSPMSARKIVEFFSTSMLTALIVKLQEETKE